MNKAQFIDAVAEAGNLSKKDAAVAVNAVTDAIIAALKNGENVQLMGFGNFEVKEREARECRNPKTGEAIKIAASKKPTFSASQVLKDEVNA